MDGETPLAEHERRDAAWYADVEKRLSRMEGRKMDGINSDKVNINLGEGGGGGASTAAVIAALGNRNQGNDNAALIAALGNRNDDNAGLAPMMAAMGAGGGGFGGGMNGILGIAALGLIFGRGRGGLFGGDGDGGGGGENRIQNNADTLAILGAIKSNSDAVAAGFATTAVALSQGFANVKDSQQASTFLLSNQLNAVNQNVSEQGCKTREAVTADGDRTRALLVARFQQEDATTIAEQNARIVALETRGHADRHHAEQTLQITNTNTAVATAQQQQRQDQEQRQRQSDLESFSHRILSGFNQTMVARQAQDIVNLGTMTASGTQAAANTQVR